MDRLIVSVAPMILGAGIDAVGDLGVRRVTDGIALTNRTVAAVGDDVIIAGDVTPSPRVDGDRATRSTIRILDRMTTPVPTRFTDDELALIDELVDSGIAESRSAVIRRGVHDLAESVRRARVGASTAASYRDQPQTPEDDALAMASATAMTESEPW